MKSSLKYKFRKLFIIAIILAIIIIALQFLYPSNLARPLLKIGGKNFWFANKANIQKALAGQDKNSINIIINKNIYTTTLSGVGVNIDPDASIKNAFNYPWYERLLPLSIFSVNNKNLQWNIDNNFDNFINKIKSENDTQVKNAAYKLTEQGTYKLVPEIIGEDFNKVYVLKQIRKLPINKNGSNIIINGQEILPTLRNKAVSTGISKHSEKVNKEFNFIFDDKTKSFKPKGIYNFVTLGSADNKIEIKYNEKPLSEYLKESYGLVLEGEPAKLISYDGNVNGLSQSNPANAVKLPQSTSKIIELIQKNENNIPIESEKVSAGSKYDSAYSSTSKGVSKLVNDWQKEQSSANIAVYFHEINNGKRQAKLNENETFFAASIYKLFLAHYVYSQIEVGGINPKTQIINGNNVATCLRIMITLSDNLCPTTMADYYGWAKITNFAKENGYKSVNVNFGNNNVSAKDTGDFLINLQKGTVANAENTKSLLENMAIQKYREAIPAGLGGVTVSNKVGFYNDYWHDAAIVNSDKSTYVLVVLTKKSNPKAIANLASRIHKIL